MNLFGLARSSLQGVNPNQQIVWLQSIGGYTTDAAGHRAPTQQPVVVDAQVQATSSKDLQLLDNINIQGVSRRVYMYGNVLGISRPDQRGGDILQFPEIPGGPAKSWKVVSVVETWPDWACVIVVLQ